MEPASLVALWGSLLAAGLAGSLHCAGMCGPLLIGFRESFDRGAEQRARGAFVWYHAGRLWTYGLLGALAGLAGESVRDLSAAYGWQRAGSLAMSIAVLGAGLLLLDVLPGVRLDSRLLRCAFGRFGGRAWFDALLRARGPAARFLLGATMGLLPCGLVYAMLGVVAALPTPLHAMAGMLVFGAGTLPSLSLVVAAGHIVPLRWRARGTRVAAVLLVLAGALMLARAVLVRPEADACPLHSDAGTTQAPS